MADNIQLNTGTAGQILATHEGSSISAVGLAQYELVQLVTGSGLAKSFVTAANPFPVFLAGQASATQNVHISSVSPTVNVNIVSQSATLQVRIAESTSAGVNIGIVNSISATVVATITGTISVVVTSLPTNIGTVNNISATVNIHIASQSATLTTVLRAAGQDTSGTVNIQGSLTTVENLSSTYTAVLVSATAQSVLVASAGAATAIRVFSIMATNKSTTLTRVKFRESAGATGVLKVHGDCALGGGGFFWKPKRAWTLPVATDLGGSCSPAASDVAITIEYVLV